MVVISWMLDTFVSMPVIDAVKSQRRSCHWEHMSLCQQCGTLLDKVARFNRGWFLRSCVNRAALTHHRNVNNITNLGCQSFVTNALMKELVVELWFIKWTLIEISLWDNKWLEQLEAHNWNWKIKAGKITKLSSIIVIRIKFVKEFILFP